MPPEMFRCTGPCGLELPEGAFGKNKGKRRPWCKPCNNAAEKARYARKYAPPPLEAIPEGFEVASLATEVAADGSAKKQFIGARPEREAPAPIMPALPAGHRMKGLSTLTDANGHVVLQWQKTTAEQQAEEDKKEAFLKAIREVAAAWPVRELVPLETPVDDDLMCVVPMGDPHFGMYSWAAETGDDYDLEIAAQYHCTAMDALIASAPNAGRGLLIDLGDFFHMDNSSNQTLRGHHQLDVDTRWPKVMRHGVQAMIFLVQKMLTKFGIVDVWCVPGNHDPHSAFAMQLCLSLFFKDEPRVRIADVAGLFYYLRFGTNLIASTHTHTIKDRTTLGETMAADRPMDWAHSSERRWYCGHVHHDSLVETRGGVIVETMRTLAGKDKFAAESGYRSGRDMKLDVFHRTRGHERRNVCGIRRIERMINAQKKENDRG